MNINNKGWMPILDIAVKAEENQISYIFYKKPVSNHLVMLERSAMPPQMKRSSLVQEGMRRLCNTRPMLHCHGQRRRRYCLNSHTADVKRVQ